MANPNVVKLTFAGDSASLDRAFQQVQKGAADTSAKVEDAGTSAKQMGDKFETAHFQLRGTQELLRGVGDASVLMGGSLGNAGIQAVFMAGAAKDLAGGLGRLIPLMTAERIAAGGIAAAALVAGTAIAAHVDHVSMLTEVQRTAADTAYYLTDGLHFVAQGVPVLGGLLGKLKDKTDQMSQSAHGLTQSSYDLAAGLAAATAAMAANGLGGGISNDPDGMAFSAGMLDGTNAQSAQFMQTLQDNADKVSAAAAKSAHATSSIGSSVSTAINAAAAKAKQKLADWQGIADKFSQISQSIADSLGPKLSAGTSDYVVIKGQSLLDKLKKQLEDTLKFKKDITALSKGGLDQGLIQQLVAGGLASLPAADELLAGGKKEIGSVNSTSRQINAAAGSRVRSGISRSSLPSCS